MLEASEFLKAFKEQYKPVKAIERPVYTIAPEDILEAFKLIGDGITDGGFALDEDNTKFYEYLSHWIIGDMKEAERGIYLFGNSGTGKSVAMRVLQTFLHSVPISYKVNGEVSRMSIQMVNAQAITSQYSHTGDFDDYINIPILCINDLGAEICRNRQDYVSEAIYMGNRVDVLKTILELRGEDETKMTLITGNFPPSAPILRKVYGDRVLSRLNRMCVPIELKGQDRRK